jgi:hypothetical protein
MTKLVHEFTASKEIVGAELSSLQIGSEKHGRTFRTDSQ